MTLLLACLALQAVGGFTPAALSSTAPRSTPQRRHAPLLSAWPPARSKPAVASASSAAPNSNDDKSNSNGGKSALARAVRATIAFLDRRYFLAGAAIAVAMAAIAPSVGCTGGPLRPELTVGWGATCGIFLLSGLTLPTSELAEAAFRVREHAAIQTFNLAFLPFAMFLLTLPLRGVIPSALRDGLLAMAASADDSQHVRGDHSVSRW